jgi:Holliday junction resolvasome RuvABC endonuclease subunit
MLLALDISSTATGWCVINPAYGLIVDIGLFKYTPETAYKQFQRDLKSIILQHKISDIAAEDCFLSKNPETFRVLSRMQGILLAVAGNGALDQSPTEQFVDIPVTLYMPSEWRRIVGAHTKKKLNYRATADCKKAALEVALTILGDQYKVLSDDVSDAVCVGYAHFLQNEQKAL